MRAPSATCIEESGVLSSGVWVWSLTAAPDSSRLASAIAETVTPLSGNLKDSPRDRPSVYLFGETRERARLLSRVPSPCRSFCLRVSGAVAPSAPSIRTDRHAARSLPSGCLRHSRDLSTGHVP